VLLHPCQQRVVDYGGQVSDDRSRHRTVLRQVVTGHDADRTGVSGPTGQKAGDQPPRQTSDGRLDVVLKGRDVGTDDVAAAVQMPVRAAEIGGLGHCDRHRCHLWPSEVVEVRLVIARGVYRGNCPYDIEGVALGAAGDQCVQPILRRQGIGGVRPAARERSDAPLGGIRGVGCVPGLMGAVEVAQAKVNEPDRRRGGETEQETAEPR
jgi:hypothetical protein